MFPQCPGSRDFLWKARLCLSVIKLIHSFPVKHTRGHIYLSDACCCHTPWLTCKAPGAHGRQRWPPLAQTIATLWGQDSKHFLVNRSCWKLDVNEGKTKIFWGRRASETAPLEYFSEASHLTGSPYLPSWRAESVNLLGSHAQRIAKMDWLWSLSFLTLPHKCGGTASKNPLVELKCH